MQDCAGCGLSFDPTRLHAEVAVRAMQVGKDVLIELPLAATLDDAHRIIAATLPRAVFGLAWGIFHLPREC